MLNLIFAASEDYLQTAFARAGWLEVRQTVRQTYMNCADPVFRTETATGKGYYSDGRMLLLELSPRVLPVAGITEVAGKLP